jgi:hypothetical protein
MKLAIHQPNFFPWYPFFEKIKEVDKFVILTHCQFEKNGYQNRFNFHDQWYTLSVLKGLSPIKDKVYASPHEDWDKIKNRLSSYKSILDEFDDCISDSLSQTNIFIIKKICRLLNINTEIKEDFPTQLRSTSRLVEICKRYKGSHYLSGRGAKEYLEPNDFSPHGIEVSFQKETTPVPILDML